MMEGQEAFDRCEAIADMLAQQEGLSTAMVQAVASAALAPQIEEMLFALIAAQGRCRLAAKADLAALTQHAMRQ